MVAWDVRLCCPKATGGFLIKRTHAPNRDNGVIRRVAFVANRTEFQRVVKPAGGRLRVMHSVVPFVQHPLENQQLRLWEAPFEIAWQFHAANVSKRRRGLPQVVPSSCRFGVWVVAGR